MRIVHVVGARPNFMKAAPVIAAFDAHANIVQSLIHTGQHYDEKMSDIFFTELGLPQPDVNLGVGSGSHAQQTAQIMMAFEPIMLNDRTDWVVVYGDVNSTMAATLVCAKLGIKVAHVEAGLRSNDRTMPEEINRIVTDSLADLLLTPSDDGTENLLTEGVDHSKIHMVGNVMIDTLVRLLPQTEKRPLLEQYHLDPQSYGLVTLHRPSNVDDEIMLRQIVQTLHMVGQEIPLIFPIHPRTRARLETMGLAIDEQKVQLLPPQGYLDFLALQRYAKLIITDSGGVQEESTYLGIPCITVRENTERPVTITVGTNILVGQDMNLLQHEAKKVLNGGTKAGAIPELWDGAAGGRVANILAQST